MKLTLVESGGLAAGLRLGRRPLVVDLTTLPEADAQELTDLVSAARRAPAAESSRTFPDEMSYTITVDDDDGEAQEALRRSDTTMSQGFADLVDRLRRLASQG
jgi:hypothetical protein